MTNANKTARNAAQAIAKNLRSQLEDSGIEFTTINLAKATVTELETFADYAEDLLNTQSLMSNPQEAIAEVNSETAHYEGYEIAVEGSAEVGYTYTIIGFGEEIGEESGSFATKAQAFSTAAKAVDYYVEEVLDKDTLEDTFKSVDDCASADFQASDEAPITFEYHGLSYTISGADNPGYSFTVIGYEWDLGENIGLFSFQDARRSAEVVIDGLIDTYFTPTNDKPTSDKCCVSPAIVLVSVIVAVIVITTTSLRIGAWIISQVQRSQTICEILRQVFKNLPLDRPYTLIEV